MKTPYPRHIGSEPQGAWAPYCCNGCHRSDPWPTNCKSLSCLDTWQKIAVRSFLNFVHFNPSPVWPDCFLGKQSKPVVTIILPKSLTLLGNFCKNVKIIHFSCEIIFGQLLLTFGNFLLVRLSRSQENAIVGANPFYIFMNVYRLNEAVAHQKSLL